ncbi:MAG: histidine--tRNA ligase [Opitutaceae bacterium]
MAAFQTLPGFRDFYPEELARRSHLFRLWRQAARAFGFSEYDAPVLEPLDLYRRKSGEEIETQLFSFTDKGGREVALRPEMTPTVCRLVGARAGSLRRPIKWFSIAEFYRYERMQRGRSRAFFQLNADVFAEPGPEAEIELIALLIQCFTGFGLGPDDFLVRLSDRNLWFYFLEGLGLDESRVQAMLAAVDKFERAGDEAFRAYEERFGRLDAALKDRVLAFLKIGTLEELEGTGRNLAKVSGAAGDRFQARLEDWKRLLDGLGSMGLSRFVAVDLGVVRGLAYYTGFVFEAFDRKGDLRALAGGGRYDHLAAKLGGPELPAVGFAIGDVTVGLLLEQRGLLPPLVEAPDLFCVIGGPDERKAAFAGIQALRSCGYRVEYPFREMAFGKQFKAAAESGARLALIFGSDELAAGVVKIRDLSARTEREVPREALLEAVREQLSP